jgi:hypothetical protein
VASGENLPMARHFIALIRAGDYAAFKHLLHDELPQTYGQWQKKHTETLIKTMASDRNEAQILGISVRPDGFASFCEERDLPRTLESLNQYAAALLEKID